MAEKPQDFNFPQTVINKLLQQAVSLMNAIFMTTKTERITQLPEGVTVTRDAKSAIGKAASIFVLYATSCAHKFAQQEGHDQVSAQNIVQAADHMGFSEFCPELKTLYQENKRDREKANEKRRERRKQQKQSRVSTETSNVDDGDQEDEEESQDDNEEEDD